ncbi:hypothetical protein HNP02_004229 [Mycobacterium sp. AZCC_0083]|nr:hypothetical protein [Mycobacterium sp. AZCC_0083]
MTTVTLGRSVSRGSPSQMVANLATNTAFLSLSYSRTRCHQQRKPGGVTEPKVGCSHCNHYQLAWTPARTLRRALVAPALPPAPPLGCLESSKSLANSKKFHGYLTLAYPWGACNLARDPRYDQKCCVRHTSTRGRSRGICTAQLHSIASRNILVDSRSVKSGAFSPPQVDDAFAGDPFGDHVHSQQGNRVPCETSGRSRPMAVSGPRGNALVPLLQWHEGRTSRGATSRHFLLNRQ